MVVSPSPSTSAPRHILFCTRLPIWALGWPHSWEEACKLCSGWTAPDKWVCVPQVHSCRGVLATHGSLCCGGLGQRFSTYVCLDIFKVRARLWFKYLTLYEGGWGFQETFLWFIKEKKPEENDQKTKWQSDSLAVFLVCLFWDFMCRELDFCLPCQPVYQ